MQALPQGSREETARKPQGSGERPADQARAAAAAARSSRRQRGLGPLIGADDDHPRPAERQGAGESSGAVTAVAAQPSACATATRSRPCGVPNTRR